MTERLEPHALEAFAAETRRILARRVPLGTGFAVALAAVAGLLELAYFPGRAPALAWSFVGEALLCSVAFVAARNQRLRAYMLPALVTTMLGISWLVTTYVVAVGSSGDALAFALIIFLTGVVLLLPWGMRGQLPLAIGGVAGYAAALALGVRGELPMPYGIISVVGGAVTSVLGASFLDQHRRAIFRQRLLLERTRDQQMARLYDVTRTVTATLELQQVLWLVCEGMLRALKLDRLWLFWREAPDGDVRARTAERAGERVITVELSGDRIAWDVLLRAAADGTPDVASVGATELAALGAPSRAPQCVLRLPLRFQTELVGLVLADCDAQAMPLAPSFVDFAATLGNSVAMAIAHARLHALVLQHRTELQQMSNKRLDMVEEGIRRLSHELHDGTCQALMAIKLDLSLLEAQLDSEHLRGAVRDVSAQVIDVVQSVRQMSHLLRPPMLDDFGAVAAIESVAEKYRETGDLDVRVESTDASVRFAPPIELLLFRIFQESVINVVKHADATRVDVRLAVEDDVAILEIHDDGRGFDAHAYFRAPPHSAGLGLIGMRERIAHFGGIFRVTSHEGRGTRIYVSVPVQAEGERALVAAL